MNISEPGMVGLWSTYPETAKPMQCLANFLLTKETPALSRGDREHIASFVGSLNRCSYCEKVHGAVAEVCLPRTSDERLAAYMKIAKQVCYNETQVSEDDIHNAMTVHGATAKDVHDVILISAAFCMFSRYVLHTGAPNPLDENHYVEGAACIMQYGYTQDKLLAEIAQELLK